MEDNVPATPQAKFTHAAVAYLIYGIIYEGFAVLRFWQGSSPPGLSSSRVALYLITGAIVMVVLPWLIYRGYRRFTQLIALLVGLRVIALVAILGGFRLFFFYDRELFFLKKMSPDAVYAAALLIALCTLFFLVRAGWDLGRSERA